MNEKLRVLGFGWKEDGAAILETEKAAAGQAGARFSGGFCFSFGHATCMWDLSSPTRDRTCAPCSERRSLNHWTTEEVPGAWFFNCKLEVDRWTSRLSWQVYT